MCATLACLAAAAPPAPAQPVPEASWHQGLFDPAVLYVEPLVLTDELDQRLLREAAADVSRLFEIPVRVRLPEPPRPDLPNERGEPYRLGDRLSFPPVAAALVHLWKRQPGLPDALAVVAVSGAPIGFPARDGRVIESATWSMRGQGVAAVSLPLLLSDLDGEVPVAQVRARMAAAMARMLGQALGLSESPDAEDVMQRPGNGDEVDHVPFVLSPTHRAELRVVRTLCAVADGRAAPGLEDRLRVRATDGQDPAAAAALAILLERRDARVQAAVALDQAMVLDPDIARAHLSRARLAYRDGHWERAADEWDRVLQLNRHAATWAGAGPPDWLLTHQGLPAREDNGAAPVWREPLDRARSALDAGDWASAAVAAQDALERARALRDVADRGLFAAYDGSAIGAGPPSRVGRAGALLAEAYARQGDWDRAKEALHVAQANLPEGALRDLDHVRLRIAAGIGAAVEFGDDEAAPWRRSFVAGLKAVDTDDPVAALDAWTPLLAALDTPWGANVPIVELAQLHAQRGDTVRARDVLLRGLQAGWLSGEGRALLARLPAREPAPEATRWPGRVLRYSVRRFRPVAAITREGVWLGTTDGLLRVDRQSRRATLQHVAGGLPPGRIQAVAADADRVWLGTATGLYVRAREGQWTTVVDVDGVPMPGTTALAREPDGAVLAGTVIGLARVTPALTVQWFHRLPQAEVAAVTCADGAAAATFTRAGPAVRTLGVWQTIPAPSAARPDTRFGAVALDELGRLALTERQRAGVAICRETPFAVYCDDLPPGTDVVGPVRGPDRRLWLAAGRELGQWDQAVGWRPYGVLPESKEPEPILALAADPAAGVWAVTAHAVYHVYEDTIDTFAQYANRAIWQRVIADPRGGVWQVFPNSLRPPAGAAGPQALPPGAEASAEAAVVLDEAGAPWAIAARRLYRARGPVWSGVAEVPEAAGDLRLWVAHGDEVWASDADGAWHWAAGTWTRVPPPADQPPEHAHVRGIVRTGDGRVWIGWDDRVQAGDGAAFSDAPGMPRTTILGLASGGDRVWVATAHDGVYRLGAQPAHWTRADGLPDNRVTTVAAAPEGAWVACPDGGVARWNGASWKCYRIGNLDVTLAADAIVPTVGGGVWFQVGETWYEHRPAGDGA